MVYIVLQFTNIFTRSAKVGAIKLGPQASEAIYLTEDGSLCCNWLWSLHTKGLGLSMLDAPELADELLGKDNAHYGINVLSYLVLCGLL